MHANQLIQHNQQVPLLTKTITMPSDFIDDYHSHPWHQIIFPVTGLLQSNINDASIIVPHNAMLYVPAHSQHKSVAVTDTLFLAIYLNPAFPVPYLAEAKSCLVTPFVKELILMLFSNHTIRQSDTALVNLLKVLQDQIDIAEHYQIPLLIPKDRRLFAIFHQLKQQPDLKYTLKEWAMIVGASERTLSRLYAKEFNLSFALWRQHIRLVLSLQLLESKRTIQDIATTLGYTSDSAYIHAFKSVFVQTPNRYRTHLQHNRDPVIPV